MNIIFRAFAALIPLLLAACLNQTSAPSTAPQGLAATAGENRVILTWTSEPGLTYWVYYKAGTSVSKDDYTGISYGATSPFFLAGLTNGTQYAFLVTASEGNSKTGPVSAVVTETPRLLAASTLWTATPNFTSNNLRGIAYGNNYYAMVGDSNTVFTATHNYPIPGGVTTTDSAGLPFVPDNSGWISATLPSGLNATSYSAVVYNGSGFTVLGEDGSTLYSTATTTWTLGTSVVWTAGASISTAGNTMNALTLGGIYVAVGNGGKIFTSAGGTNPWTDVSGSPQITTENLYGVSYVNGIYIAVGAHGTLLTSPDGTNWTSRDSQTTNDLYQVAFGLGTYITDNTSRYVAVGDAGTIISSLDSTNWSLLTPAITSQNLRTVCFGPAGQFIAANTPKPYAQFIAAGTAGDLLFSTTGDSTDPASWTASTTVPALTSNVLNSIVPTDVLIAVGANGSIVSLP